MHRIKTAAFGVTLGVSLLLATPTVAQEADHQAKLEAIQESFEQARKDWMKAYRAASEEERKTLVTKQPGPEFAAEFLALAEEAAGTEVAGSAHMWVLRVSQGGNTESCKQSIAILVSDYIDSPSITELPMMLRYSGYQYGEEFCEENMQTLAADSTEPQVQAPAMYNLAAYYIDMEGATDEHRAEAKRLLEELKTNHATVEDSRKRTYGVLADGLLNAMNIAVGKPAPEIEGKDIDGVAFKLSDYRGKVVLLDFWGHW